MILYGGEEYELIVTIKPEDLRKAKEAIIQQGGNLIKIGEATAKKALLLKHEEEIIEIEARGYEHFRHEVNVS